VNSPLFDFRKPPLKTLALCLFFFGNLSLQNSAFAQSAEKNNGLKTLLATVKTETLNLELADTPRTRQLGLMNRTQMGKNKGMLFVFEQEGTQCMWMKNTKMDLDVAFLDDDKKIINIETMKANTLEIHCATQSAKYAIEMNANWYKNQGVTNGDEVKF
jgi:uncharacterized membrane protein (UPF0127 family)